MLFGEHFRRRHDRRLNAAGDRLETRDRSDDRLAGANITLDQAHHRMRLRQVAQDFVDDALLRTG